MVTMVIASSLAKEAENASTAGFKMGPAPMKGVERMNAVIVCPQQRVWFAQ